MTDKLTLDEVSKRIDKICTDFTADCLAAKTRLDEAVEAFGAEIDASPDLNKADTIAIVTGRLRRMVTEGNELFA